MPRIELHLAVNAPPSRCFDLARSIELHVASATGTGERPVAGRLSGLMELGETVTWSARHLGLRQELTSRITAFDPPRHFRDSMVRGAFARFDHDHFFDADGTGTRMRDVFDYDAPFGVLGTLVERAFLTRYMRRFLAERMGVIKRVAESDEWTRYVASATSATGAMGATVEPEDAFTGGEITAALRALHAESVSYWTAFATADFMAPLGDAWSPADNVRHLTKSMRAVSAGLRLPRWALWLAFRGARGPSRRYAEIRETYRARLARGASAGRFAPDARRVIDDPEAERARIMQWHAAAVTEMARLVDAWSEPALDRRRLPHPLLGKLTVREMLLFTLYHNRHHVDGVRRRVGGRT